MKILGFLTAILMTTVSYAQLALNPAPVSGDINLTQANTYVYITNQTAASQTLSLNLVGSGISISSNRCSTVRANSTCYLVVSVPNYTTNSVALDVQLRNGTTVLANLKVAPVAPPSSSIFSVSSLSMDGFSNYSFTIQNKTTTVKTYAPTFSGVDAAKYSVVLNRCSNVSPNGTCLVYVKLAPQEAGSFSASISEPQVTGSISVSSTITSSTPGVILPPNPSISLSPLSQDFGTITNLGKTATKTFTITNNGNVAISPMVAVAGTGLEISINRCLSLLSPNQSCTVSVLFNAVNSMTNGIQSGLEFSAQATSSTTPIVATVSANLNVNPVLLTNSGGGAAGSLATPLLGITYGGTAYHYSTVSNKLYMWGANWGAFLGDGTTNSSGEPLNVSNYSQLSSITIKDYSFYDDHSCLLTTSNDIYCWGYNYAGQANEDNVNSNPVLVPTLLDKGDMGTKTIKKLAMGAYISYALSDDGHVYFWGANGTGQSGSVDPQDVVTHPHAGPGGNQEIVIPTEINMTGVLSGKTVKDIIASYSHACVIASDDKLYCWGGGAGSGLLGDGLNSDSYLPVAVDMSGALAGKTVKSVVMTYGNACMIASDDLLYCWGYNSMGTVGSGSLDSVVVTPQAVDMTGALAGKTIKKVSLSDTTACAIASDDKPYCWGLNSSGQVGSNSTDYSFSVPQAVDMSGALAGKTVKSLSMSYMSGSTTCAIASDDKPYCWGNNFSGQLGDGTTNNSLSPVAVDHNGVLSGKTVKMLAVHGNTTCVQANDDKIYCIGANGYGQLGTGTINIGTDSGVFSLAPTIP